MQPKNLVIIMSDEHNSKFMGCAGHEVVKTPNLDKLAASGTVFNNAYTNSPICVPARACFATGRYVHDCAYWDNAIAYDGRVPGWGHRLIEQGHRSTSIGKLHFRNSNDPNGFDEEIIPLHILDGVGDLLGLIREEMPERKGSSRFAADLGPGESTYTEYDRNIATEAVRWINEEAPKYTDKPWVLFVSFVCPHYPLIAPPEYYELYPEAEVPMPLFYAEEERPKHEYYKKMHACINYDKFFDEEKIRKAVAGYLGLCTFLDSNVGTVIDALEKSDLASETRVIYTSDHGETLGKRGHWGKNTMFEESTLIPLIMAGPDIDSGKQVDTLVSQVDFHPTILQSVGASPSEADKDLPGQSLFEISHGAHSDRTIFSEYHATAAITGNSMIRDENFKLFYFAGMEPAVYDLENDPEEINDLAKDPQYADVLAHLESKLREICDPEEVDRRAKADQAKKVEEHGGREAILKRGDFGYSPAPGQGTDFASAS